MPVLLDVSLQANIEKIFMESTGADPASPGNIPHIAEQLSQALIDWLKKQTFRIKRMEATIELENFQLLQPLRGTVTTTVSPTTGVGAGGGMLPGAAGSGTSIIPVNVSKQSGLIASGHAYIGPPAEGKPNADTTEEENDYAVVQMVDGEEVG